jgi:hypothetical protein
VRRLVLLAFAAAAAAAWYLALPPPPAPLPPGLSAPVRGALHVHTRRSDGSGTVEDVAAAAARAGLRFVILTDHGDATRAPEPPAYRNGVLCIDAVEISTADGHLVALGIGQAPYRLGGEGRDVAEDVARLGGFTIAAHPLSPRQGLRWRDWDVPVGGIEWLNGDSEWRDESRWRLARALFTYPFRRMETIAALFDRPVEAMRRWDQLAARRKVVGVVGADAHARLGLRTFGEPYDEGASLRVPAYEQVFRAFSIALQDVTLNGDAAADAEAVIEAIRGGRVHSAIDALGGPAAFSFTALHGDAGTAVMGDAIPAGPLTFRVAAQAPAQATIRLRRDGAEIDAQQGALMNVSLTAPDPGAYRVELELPGAPGAPPVPWIVSNPIYVGLTPAAAGTPAPAPPAAVSARYTDGPADDWRVETSRRSLGALDRLPAMKGDEIGFRWALGGALSESPFAALVMPAGGDLAAYDRLLFTARAPRPMRISVQLRAPNGVAGERWHRSVYIDETARPITIFFDDMRPRGVTAQPRPDLGRVQSVLFVVDAVNADTGTNGLFVVDDVRYGR